MKRFLTIISMIFALVAFSSCNKDNDSFVMTYYSYNIDKVVGSGTHSTTDVSEISNKLKARPSSFDNFTDAQAKAEWNSFVASIDDSKVVFSSDTEYVTISLDKINVYEKGEFGSENKVVATIGSKTWKKSGAVEK